MRYCHLLVIFIVMLLATSRAFRMVGSRNSQGGIQIIRLYARATRESGTSGTKKSVEGIASSTAESSTSTSRLIRKPSSTERRRSKEAAGGGSSSSSSNNNNNNGYIDKSHNANIEQGVLSNMDGSKPGSPPISWYPGHIAKAERELADYLKKVDVVIEVRDARIPLSTTHPMVPEWVGNRPLIVAIARLDQISSVALKEWKEHYAMHPAHPERPDAKVYFIDGKKGAGVLTLRKQALKAGEAVNERRAKRGIQPRAVRAAVIGFPNVGKSALINRLLGKTMAKSRNLPGVTKSLQWVRIGGSEAKDAYDSIELLDSPGIIPARQFDQQGALKLAICNDIGEASYDRVVVAAAMCDELIRLNKANKGYVNMKKMEERYELPFESHTGEELVYLIAQKFYQGNSISAADKLLGDFRKGLLGFGSLEAPFVKTPRAAKKKSSSSSSSSVGASDVEEEGSAANSASKESGTLDVGKGNYEGW